MGYIGNQPSFNILSKQSITANGTNSYTLNHIPGSTNGIDVFVSSVLQIGNYSVSSSTLTFDTIISTGLKIDIIFKALPSVIQSSVNLPYLTIDGTGIETLLVRKNADGGDVFTVDTTNSIVSVNGNLTTTQTVSAHSFDCGEGVTHLSKVRTGGTFIAPLEPDYEAWLGLFQNFTDFQIVRRKISDSSWSNLLLITAAGAITTAGNATVFTALSDGAGSGLVPDTTQALTWTNNISISRTGVAPIITINGDAGQYRGIEFRTATFPRWDLFADNGAESGGDAGSNLGVNCYADNGAFLRTALTINRSTGKVGITNLNIASIPTSAAGLVSGDIWSDGGTLKIVS